jgi:hypothetical protein
MQFDERYGLVLDQLQMLENSINESFSGLNHSRSGLYDKEGGSSTRQLTARSDREDPNTGSRASLRSNTNKDRMKAMA